jgi:hypothetical protein
MQKISRAPPVVAIDKVEPNVVRLQRRGAASGNADSSFPEKFEKLPALMERASNAARQMRYFGLAMRKFSFEELISSARRAGFIQLGESTELKEVSFQWASGPPDLIFSVSFRDPARISVVAESQADIFGLVLTAYSHSSTTSVEIKPTVAERELGRDALLFRDMLLTFSGFDDVPAWIKYPEGKIPAPAGLVEMWRDGVSVASVFGRAWSAICVRALTIWRTAKSRWYASDP